MDIDGLANPWAVIGYLAAALFAAQKTLDALERVGKVPGALRAWTRARAAERVEERAEELALRQLAAASPVLTLLIANSAAILEQVRPNEGATLRDAVSRIEAKLDIHLEETTPLIEEHHALMRSVETHIALHLDGPPA